MNTQEIIMTVFSVAYLALLNWLRLSIRSLKDEHNDEKKQTVWRVDQIYKRIDSHKSELHELIKESDEMTHSCRKEIDSKIENLMTESQVKDFVDRSLTPLKQDISEVKSSVKEGNAMSYELLSKVQILLDREQSSRGSDK